MVVAKTNIAHTKLAAQIEKRTLIRKYKALIWGIMTPLNGVIKNNMGRSKTDRKKMTVLKFGGKYAVTHYKTEKLYLNGLISLVECKLETGRTHQIRVHLSHAGHSVIGDQVYGNNKRKIGACNETIQELLSNLGRQALHSWYIGFCHPSTNIFLEFSTDLPYDMRNILDFIEKY
jgi:23S rRNA pseudouridine1911/1915/1917 synthase